MSCKKKKKGQRETDIQLVHLSVYVKCVYLNLSSLKTVVPCSSWDFLHPGHMAKPQDILGRGTGDSIYWQIRSQSQGRC